MPELKFFPETHVAFVSEIGPYKKSIPRGFKQLFDWLETNGVQPIGPLLAILYDDPARVAPENQRSDLCAPVGPHVDGSGDTRTKEIGGWKVASVSYDGEKNAPRAFEQVYDWLREQGFRPADVPVVKYSSPPGDKVHAQIGVPVIKRELMPGSRKVKTTAAKRTKTRPTAKASTARKKPARKSTRRAAR